MYTERKTENQKRIAITEWLEAHLSQFENKKNNFLEMRNALFKAINYKVSTQYLKMLLEEVAQQQGYNVSFETETIKAERRNITVFVLTQTQTPKRNVMYTERKTENQKRIAITEWLEAHLSQFENKKNNFLEMRNALFKAINYKVSTQYLKMLLEEVAQQQGYNVSFETETIKAERRNITVFVLTQIQTPPETPQKDSVETPLTIDIRACSYNPDVRSGKAPITAFDVLQWLHANTDSGITPNITADGSICLITLLKFSNGFLYEKIAQWDVRHPYFDQQPISLIKALAPYYQSTNFLEKMQLISIAFNK